MRYHVLALDYDETLATHGRVSEASLQALERLRNSSRKLALVTGRALPDLLRIFPQIHLFDRVVAENGGILYRPASREEKVLGPPPPPELITALQERNVKPLSVGRVLLASWEPSEKIIVEVIHDLGLEYHIIFNKGAVMVLPSSVNKATGLAHALYDLGFSPHNVIGAGDGENDHAFLAICECSAALSNAVESLKKRVDLVTKGGAGDGVVELIDRLLSTDLKEVDPYLNRHFIKLGTKNGDGELSLSPYGHNVLLCGTSGGGKSTLAMGFLERMTDKSYQFCIIDPEGDYGTFEAATTLGDHRHPPGIEEVLELLKKPRENVVVNLLAIPLNDRPVFFERLFSRLQEARMRFGRPHWLLIDEAHHLFPTSWNPNSFVPKEVHGLFLITVHPDQVSPALLSSIDVLVTLGQFPQNGLRAFGETVHEPTPSLGTVELKQGEAILWFRNGKNEPLQFQVEPPHTQKRRHLRKYAEGQIEPDRSFYFRGPKGKLHLRAQNLQIFIQLAEGLDDETWLHHLRNGDYSKWFRDEIKDAELAEKVAPVEQNKKISPRESRAQIISSIQQRYTLPA